MGWNLGAVLIFHGPLIFKEPAYLTTVGVSDHCHSFIAWTALEHEILPDSLITVNVTCFNLVTFGRIPVL